MLTKCAYINKCHHQDKFDKTLCDHDAEYHNHCAYLDEREEPPMLDNKPFCTIDIPDVETAAYIHALIYNVRPEAEEIDQSARHRLNTHFPGGYGAAKNIPSFNRMGPGAHRGGIVEKLRVLLRDAGAFGRNSTTAPWLTPKPPTSIEGFDVTYHGEDGIKVGCSTLSVVEMELMVKKCKGGE